MTGRPKQPTSDTAPRGRRSFGMLLVLAVGALLLFAGFAALGTWQLQRLQWKTALIERVEQRVRAHPVDAPPPARWAQISAESDEYRRVRLTGVFVHELAARVQAVTVLGGGHWLLTPMRTTEGDLVLVNRGFIPLGDRRTVGQESIPASPAPSGNAGKDRSITVTGLLRLSEPGGGFLRRNDPAGDRWYSRDVQAIAESRGIPEVAPFFIDADASHEPGHTADSQADSTAHPVGGLTVVSFPNNHLVYALTWYALALMVAGAAIWVGRGERKSRLGDAGE